MQPHSVGVWAGHWLPRTGLRWLLALCCCSAASTLGAEVPVPDEVQRRETEYVLPAMNWLPGLASARETSFNAPAKGDPQLRWFAQQQPSWSRQTS
jgi:hypothetical protein